MEDDKNPKTGIDLSGLSNIDFGPNWKIEDEGRHKSAYPTKEKKKARFSKEEKRGNKKYKKKDRSEIRNLDFKIEIKPNPEILNKTKSLMAKTGVSYSLKEISNIFSDNVDRLKFRLIEGENVFYISNFDKKIFISNEKAVDHTLNKFLKEGVIVKEVGREKPNGNFNFVFSCPKTQILLPPTNFHDFESIIKEHIFHNRILETYENYCKKLTKVEDPNEIKKWLDTPIMSYEYSYNNINKENKVFSSIEALKSAIKKNEGGQFISKEKNCIFLGSKIDLLSPELKTFVENFVKNTYNWKKELFFNILIILKKSNFHIFKYGKEKHLYAVVSKPKKTTSINLSHNCTKIIKLLYGTEGISKAEIIKICDKEDIEKGIIIKELKWLVKEGFIREFSNGQLVHN